MRFAIWVRLHAGAATFGTYPAKCCENGRQKYEIISKILETSVLGAPSRSFLFIRREWLVFHLSGQLPECRERCDSCLRSLLKWIDASISAFPLYLNRIISEMKLQWVSLRKRSVCCLFVLALNAFAQQQAEPVPNSLTVVVLQGEGTVTRIRQQVTPEPRIRVQDENQKPVAGAAVVFTLPTEGATGAFGNGSKTLIVTTDKSGEAVAHGLRMNEMPGRTSIHITASYKGLSALAIISEESVLPPGVTAKAPGKHGHGALITVLVIVAGAAAGGAVYATQRNGGSSSSSGSTAPTAIGITAGTGTIAGGH